MSITDLILSIAEKYRDTRKQYFKVQAAGLQDNTLALQGRVLEQANLDELCREIAAAEPGWQLDCSAVEVLRQPSSAYTISSTTNILRPSLDSLQRTT